MAYHNNSQQHLNPPRLCFQNRSLSAREGGAAEDEAHRFDATGVDAFWQSTATPTTATRGRRQLSASTDQLLTESFRHNVSLMPIPTSHHHHHRILPSPPPSMIGGTDQQPPKQQREALIIGNGTNRYRKRSGGSQQQQRKMNEMTESRRKEYREKAFGKAGNGQQWRSTGNVDESTAGTAETQHQQHHNQHANLNVSSFGGLKSRLAFSLFGLGKSAETERDKSLTMTTAQKQQQKQQHRRSSSAATVPPNVCLISNHPSATTSPYHPIGGGSNGTVPCGATAKRKAEATAHANGTQAGTGITTKRISNAAQQLIMSCLDKSRGDLSGRVLSRAIHKRADFSTFCANLSAAEQWIIFSEQFHKYIMDVLGSLQNVEQISLLSMHFGAEQVNRRIYGFKADFFATIANSLATECVFLDGASHSPTDAIEAWAELVEMMFSSVRDGYYAEVRRRRRCSGGAAGEIKSGQNEKIIK
ncbi:hypothetical protein niasHS_010346 [Heterodera schachtii]|uniref:Uncharacterized protein n=1 Tax=Heterodera schachtii TaxID=97005 RepID=A0ABD2J3L3_HETSC